MLAVYAVDADNHYINVAFVVVGVENSEEWLWFMQKLQGLLAGMPIVVMSVGILV